MSSSRVTDFLSLFNQLDEPLRKRLGADEKRSHANLLEAMAARDPVFQEYHSRLQAYRALRNSLVHVAWESGHVEPVAEPSEDVLTNYRMLVGYVLEPPLAMATIATREVYTCDWNVRLAEGLAFIDTRNYDTIPIVERGRLVGVYTHAALQRWLLDKLRATRPIELHPDATFEILRDEIAFAPDDPRNRRDKPRLLEIAPASSTVEDLEHQFRSAADVGRFLVCVCITETGEAFSPLLGLVTAHNLPSANAKARTLLDRRKGASR